MSRALRLEYAGACYHVINRGNYRRDLFGEKGAAAAFERVLFEACVRFGWRLHGYVIMRNHFHLALETPEPNLSTGMKWLQGTWVARFNRWRGLVGRPFQGRFKSLHVQPGHALAQVVHYIHLNPVRAKIVPAQCLSAFRWSSLHHFARRGRAACLAAETVLAESGGLSDNRNGWSRYRSYLVMLAEEDPEERQTRFAHLSRGWCVGTREFRETLRRDLQLRHAGLEKMHFEGLEPEVWQNEREAIWEEKLQEAATRFAVDLSRLPGRKSAPIKVMLAAWMKRTTGVSNRWIAARLRMGTAGSVSPLLHRFRIRGGEKAPAFQSALSDIQT